MWMSYYVTQLAWQNLEGPCCRRRKNGMMAVTQTTCQAFIHTYSKCHQKHFVFASFHSHIFWTIFYCDFFSWSLYNSSIASSLQKCNDGVNNVSEYRDHLSHFFICVMAVSNCCLPSRLTSGFVWFSKPYCCDHCVQMCAHSASHIPC